jgi:soluble lytic murein transglycosylase-like protein
VERSGGEAPVAAWVAGLTSWQSKNYKRAARYFETVANSQYASAWTVSSGAFWASRAHMRAKDFEKVNHWLGVAADHPRTFYGLLALQSLGHDFDFNWRMPEFSEKDKDFLLDYAAGRRAMSLIRVGQSHRADAEIRGMNIDDNKRLRRALLAFAHEYGLSAFAMKYANAYRDSKGRLYDAALYPVPRWRPGNGFQVDRAVIYALARQESRFNPLAENPSGATGLMQLMPSTASYVADKARYHDQLGRYLLKNPRTNMRIGQRYVRKLLERDSVNGDLLAMAIAYNAGPGNLRKWRRTGPADEDPLLFIETIPAGQTRAYVERVLRNIWIYRIRLGQQTPSLRALASGERAHYVALDGKRGVEVAETIKSHTIKSQDVKRTSETGTSDDGAPVWTRQ